MKRINIALALCASLLANGCASNHSIPYQSPAPKTFDSAIPYQLRNEARNEEAIFVQAKRISTTAPIYYFQNYGGGGMAVGLALGPLGVLANATMIENARNQDAAALSNKVPVDPVAIAGSTLANHPRFAPAASNTQGLLISPYMMIVKGEQDRMLITTTIEAESGAWRGRYSYHLDYRKPFSAFASSLSEEDTTALQASVEEGFKQAMSMLENDLAGKMVPVRDITFYTEAISPRIKLPQHAKLISPEGDYVTVLGAGASAQLNGNLGSGYHKISRYRSEISNR